MLQNILILLLSVSTVYSQNGTHVTVVTNKGPIQGYKRNGYSTFFGVPYAKVDEENPFGNSLEYPTFETPFLAYDSSIMCPQITSKVGGILQCLRLNIYVPDMEDNETPRPILVWFHGGGFVLGSAGDYGGQHLVKHGIIVITVNYRLGPYGFLCLKEPSVPGNQGLKDQVTALEWIKANIVAFNGDPNKVTIAGESYGGGAVDLHLYSKYDVLFDKVIVQSGSIFTPGFFVKRDTKNALKLAVYLGHNVNTTKSALQILAKENPLVVMSAARNLNLKLSACKEKRFKGVHSFVTKYPSCLNNGARIKNTAIMFGYNSKEDFGTFANKPKQFYDELGNIFYNNLRNYTDINDMEIETVANITRRFYLGSKDIGPEAMLELSDYASDFKLNHAAETSVNMHIQQGAKVYKYLFSYVGGSMYGNVSGVGAMHTEELKYLFEVSTKLKTQEQVMMRERMTTMWANFVKTGNPTPKQTALLPETWVLAHNQARPYLDIDVNMTMKSNVYSQRMAFWDLFWHKFDKKVVVYKENVGV
ncbi:unnamed protein product [Chrysodeixis includens]|uniref:Carboxylesterase type B domain-containing protein n=1 Tax=Chrysodeixis includens TaxID=689277 RepID=A0A9P0BWG1_CHRIL|nr:unnamed protein product [Chrysodeixis includens]